MSRALSSVWGARSGSSLGHWSRRVTGDDLQSDEVNDTGKGNYLDDGGSENSGVSGLIRKCILVANQPTQDVFDSKKR
jgi:hypothetical protein